MTIASIVDDLGTLTYGTTTFTFAEPVDSDATLGEAGFDFTLSAPANISITATCVNLNFATTNPATPGTVEFAGGWILGGNFDGNDVLAGGLIDGLESALTVNAALGPGTFQLLSYIGGEAGASAPVLYPDATWTVTITLTPSETSLFTSGDDTVDFNNLTSDQQAA